MTVYWTACLASVAVAWLGLRSARGRENKTLLAIFSGLPLMLVSAFRYDVGMDYLLTYVSYFEKVQSGWGNYDRLEPLYHLINWIVIALNGDVVWIFVIAAVLFITFVYLQIFRDSPYPELSIFLLVGMGFYFVSFNAMRQMIGCAILLYAVRYIEERKLMPFAICVAIAAGFHQSCIVFAVMYWAGRIRIRPVAAWILTAALIILNEGVTWLLKFIISLTRYGIYFSSVFDTGETAVVMLAINAVFLGVASICYQENRKYTVYYNLQLVALWITILSGSVALFLRLLWAFGLPSIIMLPMAILRYPGAKSRRLIIAAVVLLYFVYTMYTVGVNNSNSVLPYQTILRRWI